MEKAFEAKQDKMHPKKKKIEFTSSQNMKQMMKLHLGHIRFEHSTESNLHIKTETKSEGILFGLIAKVETQKLKFRTLLHSQRSLYAIPFCRELLLTSISCFLLSVNTSVCIFCHRDSKSRLESAPTFHLLWSSFGFVMAVGRQLNGALLPPTVMECESSFYPT